MNVDFDWVEIDDLINLLNRNGVSYLLGNGSSENEVEDEVDMVEFIQRLAACSYPLVVDASISLFILHPELAPSVVEALRCSTGDIAENIAVATLAALYMQRWWNFRLGCTLGRLPRFPEDSFVALWEERHLPVPQERYGMDGLLALEEYQQQRYGIALNFRDDWQNQINHLLNQEEAKHHAVSDELLEALKRNLD